ncbi:MAG: ABC transporter permease [Anaerolineaceae bacterium]
MKGYWKYFRKKLLWLLVTVIFAFMLNFLLPRLMPGNPVAGIVSRIAQGMSTSTGVKEIYDNYAEQFGINKPLYEQFIIYVRNIFKGEFGVSFTQYPRPVVDIIRSAVTWTIALQLPAIIIGWILGNTLGAVAAYRKGPFDKTLLPISIFISNFPAFGMAVILLVIFAVKLKWFPTSGGYGFDMIPTLSWSYILSVLHHYVLPFLSIVLITIGGQAIGMRSMAIYELNADYVKYSRFMGIKDNKIVQYVFRNAMLPQLTGLALSIGTMVGGSIVAEIVFSYPGLGTALLSAIQGQDYPLVSAITLIITIMVLIVNFVVEIIYGFIDPRIRATQAE